MFVFVLDFLRASQTKSAVWGSMSGFLLGISCVLRLSVNSLKTFNSNTNRYFESNKALKNNLIYLFLVPQWWKLTSTKAIMELSSFVSVKVTIQVKCQVNSSSNFHVKSSLKSSTYFAQKSTKVKPISFRLLNISTK